VKSDIAEFDMTTAMVITTYLDIRNQNSCRTNKTLIGCGSGPSLLRIVFVIAGIPFEQIVSFYFLEYAYKGDELHVFFNPQT